MKKILVCSTFLLAFVASVHGQKPNVVLIVSDDQGMDMLGCYGDKNAATPHIDQLAAEGVRFTRAYCTTPSCSPSRSVILTGLHSHRNGQYGLGHSVQHFRTHESVQTLPVLLTQLGYYTLHVGKGHIYPKDIYRFDASQEEQANNPAQMVANVDKMLAAKPEQQPFFLFFATIAPHHSGGPDKKLPFAPDRFGRSDAGYPGITERLYQPETIKVPYYLPDLPESRAELAQYYQAIHRLDQGVGLLVKLLKDKGIYDNTIIIFTSDNGAPFASAKTNLYDQGVRMPFVVKTLKDKVKNKTTDALIAFTDITPTVLDLVGIYEQSLKKLKETAAKDRGWEYQAADTAFQGKSFKPILEMVQKNIHEEVYLSHSLHTLVQYYPMRAVVTDRYKLIWNLAYQLSKHRYKGTGESITDNAIFTKKLDYFGSRKVKDIIQRPEFELYDLQNDPHELKNMAYEKSSMALRDVLQTKILQFQRATQDPFLQMTD